MGKYEERLYCQVILQLSNEVVVANTRFHISVLKCPESGAFVGTSPDIPGLTLEADSHEQLLDAVAEVVPQLLVHNLKLSEDRLGDCTVEVIFEDGLAERRPGAAFDPRRPRILVEHLAAGP